RRRRTRPRRGAARAVAAHRRELGAAHEAADVSAGATADAAADLWLARRGVRQDSDRTRGPRRSRVAGNRRAAANGVRTARSAAPVPSDRETHSRRAPGYPFLRL